MADVFKDNDRLNPRVSNDSKGQRYRAFRNELQREIFDNKNYDVSIKELSKKYGLSK